jgi:UTP--glucose-1-phosphate uridylyltransferase
MGDDFIYNQDGSSEVARLIKCTKSNAEAGMLGVEVPDEELELYGAIKANQFGIFEAIIEKPKPKDAPSNLINVSKFIFPSALMQSIEIYTKSKNVNGEYMITEAINNWVKSGGIMRVCQAKGKYLDGGNPVSWLAANNYVADHPR